MAICPECEQRNDGEARFCGKCGAGMQEGIWGVGDDRLARLYTVDDLEGWWSKPLTIRPNQKALIFVKGEFKGEVRSGQVDMGGFKSRLLSWGAAKTIQAVVVREGATSLTFGVRDCRTRDAFTVEVECLLRVQIENAMAFHRNLMGDSRAVSVKDLRQDLYPTLRSALQRAVSTTTLEGLRGDPGVLLALEREVLADVDLRIAGYGLTAIGLELVAVRHEGMEQLDQARERTRLAHMGAADEIAAEDAEFGFDVQREAQKTRRGEAHVSEAAVRIRIRERMRRTLLEDRMGDERTKQDELEFLAQVEKEGMGRQDEVDAVRRALDEGNEDHAIARQHALELLTLRQAQEVGEAESVRDVALTEADVRRIQADLVRLGIVQAGEQQLALQELNHELVVASQRLESALELDRKQYDEGRRRRDEAREDGTKDWEEDHRRDRVVTVDARGDRREDFEQDLHELRGLSAVQQERAEAEVELEQQAEHGRQDIADRVHTRTEQTAARLHDERLAFVDRIRDLPVEQLIAVTDDAERAALLTGIRRDEITAGMTEDQLLALRAADSPAVAEAIKARYVAMAETRSHEERTQLLERLVESERGYATQVREILEAQAERSSADQRYALDAIKEMGVAAAKGGGTVVLTPSGQVVPLGDGAETKDKKEKAKLVCRECKAEVDASLKYCPDCGAAIR